MSDEARKLLQDLLALSLNERAAVVTELLASLDGAAEGDVQEAWAVEVERRARLALANPCGGTDWHTASDEIRAELRALRAGE